MTRFTLILLTLLVFCPSLYAQNLYRVIKIYDGDTVKVTDGNLELKVRLMGIDAPEYKQKYGTRSKAALSDMILGKNVSLVTGKRKLDMYNRILAHVYLNDVNVGAQMIQEGWAYYYRPYCQDYPSHKNKYNYDPRPYIQAEIKAKSKGLGVWTQARPQLPCLYRKKYKRKKH